MSANGTVVLLLSADAERNMVSISDPGKNGCFKWPETALQLNEKGCGLLQTPRLNPTRYLLNPKLNPTFYTLPKPGLLNPF